MNKQVHVFDNGVQVYKNQLLDLQIERYRKHNVHEVEEESVFLDALSRIDHNGIYVNVGSAIGYYPLLARLKRPDLRIHAFEPLRLHRNYFYKNIILNGFKKSDFKLHKEGVYSRSGGVSFMVMHYGSMIQEGKQEKNILRKAYEYINNTRINCITLEELCERMGPVIDLLQMDIQGLERDVMFSSEKTLKTGAVRQFLIGTHASDIHKDCKGLLLDNGYNIIIDNYETTDQPDGILMAARSEL